jgi:hypothetical protein
VKAVELNSSTDCDELAHFLYAALHGAILQSKVDHSAAPMERFKKTLFAAVLRPAPPALIAGHALAGRLPDRRGEDGHLDDQYGRPYYAGDGRPAFALRRNESPEAVGFRSADGPVSSVERPSASQRR